MAPYGSSSGTRDIDDALMRKYQDMKNTRGDFDIIDPKRFLLPTMGDMTEEDLMASIYQEINNINGSSDSVTDTAFYSEPPFSTELGYHPDEGVFVLKARMMDDVDTTWSLNKVDGDTYIFNFDDLDDGGKPFILNGKEYSGFKDYVHTSLNNNTKKLTIRVAGINCPEIPHFEVQAMRKTQIITKTYKEVRTNTDRNIVYNYLKYPIKNNKTTIRNDNDILKFYSAKEDKLDKESKQIYYEIVDDKKVNPSKLNISINPEYEYNTIVTVDDSTKTNVIGGYKAQDLVKGKMSKSALASNSSREIYLVINSVGITGKNTKGNKLLYNNWFLVDDVIEDMIKDWENGTSNPGFSRLSYMPYGMDAYSRFLGTAYVKENQGENTQWINMGKYVLGEDDTMTQANPDYTSSPELNQLYNGLSDAFKLWSYDKNNIEWLDGFENMTKKSYEDRIKLHKDLTGIDFTKARECTVLIGDTLFLIPPQNIRNISSVDYEKVGVIRGKGTLVKNNKNKEQILELDLYFQGESGINGIPYETKLPNGEKIIYYMNGLRSLVAQFKLSPFLPIENAFINDVLNIETVSLVSLNITTVEGYPQLLKATLTVRDFNYRVFMPDIPIDDGAMAKEADEIAEMNPIFAKCIKWELFRYYYQRTLIRGNIAKQLDYTSYDYNTKMYEYKNVLQPASMCNSDISFYVPDKIWLTRALQAKKNKDNYKQMLVPIELTDDAKQYVSDLRPIYDVFQKIVNGTNSTYQYLITDLINLHDSNNNRYLLLKNSGKFTNLVASNTGPLEQVSTKRQNINGIGYSYTTIKDSATMNRMHLHPIFSLIEKEVRNCNYVYDVSTNCETLKNTDDVIILKFTVKVKLDTAKVSPDDLLAIKESIKNTNPDDFNDVKEILKDNCLDFVFTMNFDKEDNLFIPGFKSNSDDSGKDTNGFTFSSSSSGYNELKALLSNDGSGVNEEANDFNNYLEYNVQDYKNPANMPFVPYLEDINTNSLMAQMSNSFTDIALKAVDGYAPQYMGSQDIVIELQIITTDLSIVTALNALPSFATEITKVYRRIMPCWSIKVKNDYLQLIGVNEVLIDSIQVSNVEEYPGAYEINMRLTSVDRTQRQRESLRRIEIQNQTSTSLQDKAMKTYWQIDDTLSQAELYPDLDLPSVDEISKIGYRFVRYSNKIRVYPDPDFYFIYSFPYTSMIIKDAVSKFLAENVYSQSADESFGKLFYTDTNGMSLYSKIENSIGMSIIKGTENERVKEYDKTIQAANESLRNPTIKKSKIEDKKNIKNESELSMILTYLTACNVQEGWTLKPEWIATLCENYTNDAIELLPEAGADSYSASTATTDQKNNVYARQIFELRKKAIKIIDEILDKPLINTGKVDNSMDYEKGNPTMKSIVAAVNDIFQSDKGKELCELLFPLIGNSDISDRLFAWDDIEVKKCEPYTSMSLSDKRYFKKPKSPLNFIAGFAFASACTLSGQDKFTSDKKTITQKDIYSWTPNQFVLDVNNKVKTDKDGNLIPYSRVETKTGKNNELPVSYIDAYTNGTKYGMFLISRDYTTDNVIDFMTPKNKLKYAPVERLPMYRKYEIKKGEDSSYYHGGYLDPYYNCRGWKSKAGLEYREAILKSKRANTEAFLRIVLQYLRKLIIDGLFFSEIDIIAKDYQTIVKGIVGMGTEITDASLNEFFGGRFTVKQIQSIIKSIPETFNKSFCSRMVYPFLLACSDNNKTLESYFYNRDISTLNSLTSAGALSNTNVTPLDKFLAACCGIEMFDISNASSDPETTSDSQKLINTMMKNIWIEASEDPRLYVTHSFYDMLVNDKRGRLLRAFPTYYLMFVDEGRRIGSWKLFDNFYNMSAISEIQVVKSRKIAPDTCRFVMSNMYDSYATTYDNATSQLYSNMYNMRDVFNSIFCPNAFIQREDALRKRKILPDKVVLKPGVRVHVRMGYGSDGARLPVVFNGKIAEIETGDVAEVICQGDGHELMNPLNAFGELEATALEEAQDWITIFKDLRGSLARGGETPRNLLTKLLSAKYGGVLKNAVKWASQDQLFNDNPFGIAHFGDYRYTEIFNEGEVVQNLYEVSDSTLMKGTNEIYTSEESGKVSPTINTTIQDKTLWNILHMCANAGVEYFGAVRDFGMRSTIFLGKANHYYAYAYDKVDNKVVEKRKPFQQFHYYDSYTDIIYNTIKASEKNIKTNATGIWQSTKATWGREQSTVGPVFLDMNIYPEYQKAMTVDTGLMAAGNGGIDIPFFNHYAEKWRMDPNDDKVNKSLAERMTTNILKESIKDMYEGELCVIGDPSVKPYDRFMIQDVYEDMQGQMEVESVIYSMNIENGFTTTIIPDLIVRTEDSHEPARQHLFDQFGMLAFVGITQRIAVVSTLANDNKLVRAIARNDFTLGASKTVQKMSENLVKAAGLDKYILPDVDGNVKSPMLSELLNKVGLAAGFSADEVVFTSLLNLSDDLALFSFSDNLLDKKNITSLGKALELVSKYDSDEYKRIVTKLYETNKDAVKIAPEEFNKLINNIDDYGKTMASYFDDFAKSGLNAKDGFIDLININFNSNTNVQALLEIIDNEGSVGYGKKRMQAVSKLLNLPEIQNAIIANDELGTSFRNSLKDISANVLKFGDEAKDISKGLRPKAMESLKNLFKAGNKFGLATLGLNALYLVGSIILTNNAKEFLTRWIRNIQALTVYPVTKYDRILVAGMNGHRGSVYGYADAEGWDSIQGMIMKFVESINNTPIVGGLLEFFITSTFLDMDVYNQTVERWKDNLEISDSNIPNTEKFNQQLYTEVSNEFSAKAKGLHALKTTARLKSFDTDKGKNPTYTKYKIVNLSPNQISTNEKIKELYPVEDDPDIKAAISKTHPNVKEFSIAHSTGNAKVNIGFEHGNRVIKYISNNGIFDLPMVREECIYIIKMVLNEESVKDKVIYFKNGTQVNNDKKTWKNTGFNFTLECTNGEALENAVKSVKKQLEWNNQDLFNYQMSGNKAIITVYPPVVIK